MTSEKAKNRTTQLVYWVLAATAIVGVVFFMWPREEIHTKLRGELILSDDAMEVVSGYLQWTQEASKTDMDLSHDFAANGLTSMADALQVLSAAVSKKVAEDAEFQIDTINIMASQIVKDPDNPQHTEMVRGAFTASEKVLTSVQTYSFPKLDGEIEALKQKVSLIKPDKLMLDQKNEIVEVYKQVAVILKKMTDDKGES